MTPPFLLPPPAGGLVHWQGELGGKSGRAGQGPGDGRPGGGRAHRPVLPALLGAPAGLCAPRGRRLRLRHQQGEEVRSVHEAGAEAVPGGGGTEEGLELHGHPAQAEQ